ncbi:MAG: dTDP-4-dehydrorhamnose reductase [Blastocatellia bacterium]|nr:dTDP-4-dehydrorhamnose reductase [Blastocatellia bacterium]
MKILLTGAAGLLGSQLAAALETETQVIRTTRQMLDLTNPDQVQQVVQQEAPQVVVNCAAMTGVDACELHPQAAFQHNATGPGLLAQACRKIGANLIHISTDYVFDGSKADAYTPEDHPSPLSVYGKSKLAGEQAVQNELPTACIVRVAGLYGIGGRNFASTLATLLTTPGTIRAVADNRMLTTYVPDVVNRLCDLIKGQYSGLFHVTNDGIPSSWYEFAQAGAILLGTQVRAQLVPVHEAELHRPAPRPMNSTLHCTRSEQLGLRPLPDWHEALARHLKSDR